MKKTIVLLLAIILLMAGCSSSSSDSGGGTEEAVAKVEASPAGQEFTSETLIVTLKLSGDNITVSKYTTDGTDPSTSETANNFVNNDTVILGRNMTSGDIILKLYAENESSNDSLTYTYTKVGEESSFSWDNALVYFLMTDRFYNGDSTNDNSYGRRNDYDDGTSETENLTAGTFHGGDIKGLTDKLDEGYFTDLGVNAMWITAPYEQAHGFCGGGSGGDFPHFAYHGYYGLDWTEMDKNMGTVEEFRTFVNTAHEQGIRVIMDVVLNHPGYQTMTDSVEYNYGNVSLTLEQAQNWEPSSSSNWHGYHDLYYDYTSDADWQDWWGSDWVRAGFYNNTGSGNLTGDVGSLPDFITEETSDLGLAPLLATKWSMEETGYDDWIIPAAKDLRQDLNIAPTDYFIKWLAAWVEEFGIDGFRADTAKHVDMFRWAELKAASQEALTTWRTNNPTLAGANWTDDFWMTAEVNPHGVSQSDYHTEGNFDSVINFEFPKTGSTTSIGTTWQTYADSVNADSTWNILSYISSHDTALTRGDMIANGTNLLLAPGGVQIYYGDETEREFFPETSDSNQGTRSDMNFGENSATLAHWQKLGKFRRDNMAVGAGEQTTIASNTYGRSYGDNKVVIRINASGTVSVNVGDYFANGETVRNAYTGDTAVVADGAVSFEAQNGVILIEKQ